MRTDNLKRLVSVLLSFSLVVGAVAYRPQKVNAFAVTSSAIVAGVCAIMATIGVTYWAKSKTDAQDYIAGKLDEYMRTLTPSPESLQAWLGLLAGNTLTIYEILSGNRLRFTADVGNKILDFCRWFVQQTGLVSGGEAVTNAGFVPIKTEVSSSAGEGSTISVEAQSDNALVVDYYLWRPYSSSEASAGFYVPVDTTAKYVTVTCNTSLNDGTWGTGMAERDVNGRVTTTHSFVADSNSRVSNSSKYQYLYIRLMFHPSVGSTAGASGTVSFTITPTEDLTVPVTAVVTPSENVSVPDAIPDDGTIVVFPSVTVTESMTVDDAADSILEGVVSEDGLTATVEGDVVGVPAAWAWLSDLITGIGEKIDGLSHGIAEAIAGLFIPADGFVADFVDSLYATFSERVGILTYPLAVAETFMMRFLSEPVGEPVLSWGAIQEPFSGQVLIQAGSYNLNSMLDDAQMVRVYGILQLVLKAGFAVTFFELCRRKYNSIIHGEAS